MRLHRALLAAAVLAAVALTPATTETARADVDIDIDVVIPEPADGPFEVTNAELRWGLNVESGSGAFYGGCNFLSAGVVGDTEGGQVWTEQDGFYAATAGATTIEKPYETGSGDLEYRQMSFADRCLKPDGSPVLSSEYVGTGVQAVLADGVGQIDPEAGTAQIAWEGAFTVVYYGGLTYWWVQDPVLTVTDGVGTLTGTVGGYGTDMDDLSKWVPLPDREVVLADLPVVALASATGFTSVPAYREVQITTPGGSVPQLREGDHWGSFPQSFVDFHLETGQHAYWYSSGGIRDRAKPASAVYISYDADYPTDLDPRDEIGDDPGGGGGVMPPLPGLLPPGTQNPPSNPGAGSGPGPSNVPAIRVPGAANGSQGQDDEAVAADRDSASDDGATGGSAVASQALWPGGGGLIPALADHWADPRTRAVLALSGVFGLGSIAIIGFRRGWLVLPWRGGGG